MQRERRWSLPLVSSSGSRATPTRPLTRSWGWPASRRGRSITTSRARRTCSESCSSKSSARSPIRPSLNFFSRIHGRPLSTVAPFRSTAHLDPAVRRIVLHDARAVLGWDEVREIENRFGTVALRGALRKAMHAGVIAQRPLRPLALLLLGALREGCLYIADAENSMEARTK